MIRSLCLIFFLVFICSLVQGQKDTTTLLVYFEDHKENQSTYILETLRNLRYATPPKDTFFKEVLGMEQLTDQLSIQTDYRQLLDFYAEGSPVFILNNIQRKYRQKTLEKLLSFDYILQVKVSEESILQRGQIFIFRLYKVLKGKAPKGSDTGTLLYPIGDTDVLEKAVTITDVIKRKQLLSNTLGRLFPSTNAPPSAVIAVNKQKRQNKIYYLALGDSLLVDATLSEDTDTKRTQFIYYWEQLDTEGKFNIPTHKTVPIRTNTDKQYLSPLSIGDYLITLVINDGIINSNEDSLFLRVIQRPKLIPELSLYPKRKKESLFQFLLNRDTYRRLLEDTISFSLLNRPHTSYILNTPVISGNNVSYQIITRDSSLYQLQIKSRLRYRDTLAILLEGQYQGIDISPAYYYQYRPKRDFFKLSFGTELFAGPYILGYPQDSIGLFAPSFTANGGIYLAHWDYPESSIAFEGGVSWFTGKAGELFTASVAGKLSLKMECYCLAGELEDKLGTYLALHLFGTHHTLSDNTLRPERHYGFSIGFSIKPLNMEIDMINLYHNFKQNGLSMSGGIRFNIASIFGEKIPSMLERKHISK